MGDRMFNVLVLGGMALVGCGGTVTTQGGASDAMPGDDASSGNGSSTGPNPWTDTGTQGAADAGAVGAQEGGSTLVVFPNEAPPPPPPPPSDDAASSDAGPDAYADATITNPGCRVPCEAPPM